MLERPRLLAARSAVAVLPPPNALALAPLLRFCGCALGAFRGAEVWEALAEGREVLAYPRSPPRFIDAELLVEGRALAMLAVLALRLLVFGRLMLDG
jgi:hypothetical protein